MIVLIGGEKGGTGKSTLSVNLAALHASRKKDVLLLDADKQASATKWAQIRMEIKGSPLVRVNSVQKQGKGLTGEVLGLAERYEDIVIDTGGRDSVELRAALVVSDLALFPFQPSQFDMWSAESISELVEMARGLNPNLRVLVCLTKASTNPVVREYLDAQEYLSGFPNLPMTDTIIRDRISWRRCIPEGRAIFEMPNTDEKAIVELVQLYRTVFESARDKKVERLALNT